MPTVVFFVVATVFCVANLRLQKQIGDARASFLGRAREIMPITVVHEHDTRLVPLRFWRWAPTIDSAQVDDPALLASAVELRRLRRWARWQMLAMLPLLATALWMVWD
ncbi:MAG: hypothetical protein ACREPE_01915 [Lysobacter sp.]